MSIHYHSEDIVEYGLQDGCDRCKEHASHPLESLDDGMLTMMAERIRHNVRSRSDNEALAYKSIAQAMNNARRLARLGIIDYSDVMSARLDKDKPKDEWPVGRYSHHAPITWPPLEQQ